MSKTPDAKLYQLMTDRVQDYAIFLLDTDGVVISWNAGAALIKQYRASEIIGRHFSIFYTPVDIARNWPAQELERALMDGRFEDEGWRVRKDGTRFWANVIITALRDDHGTLLGYSKITRDLSERKREEETLRQSEERFRLLVDGVHDYAIYMLSPDGIVSSWNSGAHRIKGYGASEVIGSHFSKFYSADDIKEGKPWIELAIARETGRAEDEGWRVRKDGSRFWARVVVTALRNPDGTLRGFAKVTQDLTYRRQAEALATSAGKLNEFIAVLAHELRNPLAPIRNAVGLQRLAKPGDPIHERAREIIDRQSGQLARIVEDLLDINRVTRGTFSIDRKPMDVASVIERAVETSRPTIEDAHHTLRVTLAPFPLQINGDEVRLGQALTNLLNNAARYTDPGGSIDVEVAAVESDGSPKVRIEVRDTGRGIAPELLHSIFGMFVQGRDALHRPASGLGVGLALARSIVELHHGTLEAKSEGSGKGAQFVICLPMIANRPGVDSRGAKKSGDEPAHHDEGRGAQRIMVVDDNADAAAMLASLLHNHGHDVRVAVDGRNALEMAREFAPHVVLLDIGMPGMNGLEVARRLRQQNQEPRPLIAAVTGWSGPTEAERSLEAGFDVHLVKPVEEADLLKLLDMGLRPFAGPGGKTVSA